ncbi:unnamed protein product, partial [Ixodes pacificus]
MAIGFGRNDCEGGRDNAERLKGDGSGALRMIPDVSKTCIDKMFTDHLGYAKVCARWVSRMLMEDHKWRHVEAAREFLQAYETDGEEFLDSIVTGDETWVHYTTPKTKQQSRQWKHPESPKPRKFEQTLS